MYTCASHWEELAFVTTWSRSDQWSTFRLPFFVNLKLRLCKLFPDAPCIDDFLLFHECNTSVTRSHQSRAMIPSIRKPASNEIISDSVQLYDTDVCFLHVQLMGTYVRLPKIREIHPDVNFESSTSPAKSESLIDAIDNVELYYSYNNIVGIHLCDECKRSNELSVCHKLLSIPWLLEQVCSLITVCQISQLCQVEMCQGNLRAYIGHFSNRFQPCSLK